MRAITAITGYIENGQPHKLIERVKFTPPKKQPELGSAGQSWPGVRHRATPAPDGPRYLSRPRVKRVVDLLQPRVVDVRVDLRRGDAGVAEHFLHLPQVGAAGQADAWRSCAAASAGSTRPSSRPVLRTA